MIKKILKRILLFFIFLLILIGVSIYFQYNPRINSFNKKNRKLIIQAKRRKINWPYKPRITKIENKLGKSIRRQYLNLKAERKDFILIDKSDRKLSYFYGGAYKFSIPIALGGTLKDKVRRGDKATPEGIFYICTINKRSRYDQFFGISYPNKEDAERGLHDNLISHNQAAKILYATRLKRRPSWNTILGGAIGIHGVIHFTEVYSLADYKIKILWELGSGYDWTLGCIATDSKYLNKLSKYLTLRMPVLIQG